MAARQWRTLLPCIPAPDDARHSVDGSRGKHFRLNFALLNAVLFIQQYLRGTQCLAKYTKSFNKGNGKEKALT